MASSCECDGFKCVEEGGRVVVSRKKPGSDGKEELMPVRVTGNGRPFTPESCPIAAVRTVRTT